MLKAFYVSQYLSLPGKVAVQLPILLANKCKEVTELGNMVLILT